MFLGLNNLDLLLIVILFIGILVGFMRGALPQVFSAVSIWLGLVASLWLYKPFSINILQAYFGRISSDTLAFFILLIVFFNAFRLIVKSLAKPPEERKRKKMSHEDPLAEVAKSATDKYITGPLNALGGMFMGFVLTTLWMAIILGAFQFVFQDTVFDPGVSPPGVSRELKNSILTQLYFNRVLWALVQSVDLFIPKDATILETVVRKLFESL